MTNPELFYETFDITKPDEVKAAYLFAQENNIKYYRAISKANHGIYGWDARKGQYIMLDTALKTSPNSVEQVEGAYWFVNSNYIVPATNAQEAQEVNASASPASPILTKVELASETTADVAPETPYIIDYKTLYERLVAKHVETKKKLDDMNYTKEMFESARASLTKKAADYDTLKASYLKAREAQHKTYEKVEEVEEAIKELSETLEELKDDVNSIKFLNLE